MSDELYIPPTPKKDNRQLALGLAIAAALCMLYGGFTKKWLVNGGHNVEIGFGLRSNFMCMTDYEDKQVCKDQSNGEAVELVKHRDPKLASSAFVPTGWITFISLLLAALGLLGAAAVAATKKPMDLRVAPTTIGLLFSMIALITGCVFVATKPGPPGMVGVGLSFWIFGIGSVMGIVGAQMLAKVNRPPDPEWTVD
jgi:hypothetical protein